MAPGKFVMIPTPLKRDSRNARDLETLKVKYPNIGKNQNSGHN